MRSEPAAAPTTLSPEKPVPAPAAGTSKSILREESSVDIPVAARNRNRGPYVKPAAAVELAAAGSAFRTRCARERCAPGVHCHARDVPYAPGAHCGRGVLPVPGDVRGGAAVPDCRYRAKHRWNSIPRQTLLPCPRLLRPRSRFPRHRRPGLHSGAPPARHCAADGPRLPDDSLESLHPGLRPAVPNP